ncbi:threonine synthase [Campylobacter sp. faydin G-24]|uniref:Threonine synthase n=1 Tax=Campylobacter anatolicus TaxID=2829105 RepID=A0ABS5HHQ3_9BACT|nr:threonine synthase [Campylobacter anatolicus]MBR8462073.1 threonine synthase [Campylobacter anatolicus]MBR8463809.1 threonine synthase [Campylobacter anatolicus]MBR8464840.1 threonine synthase [Campylobacter anatolicus]
MAKFICTSCGASAPLEHREFSCSCGGLFRLDYTPPKFSLDLIDKDEFSLFRYRKFMPLQNELWREISLGEGMSASIKFNDKLYFKLDYAMPTLSFKDRGAAVLIWLCKSIGVKKVLQDSSGNAGNSVAAYCARAGIECEIFVPKGTSEKKINMIKAFGASAVVYEGSRDETADACRKKARDEGIYYANHVYNPLFYQGTKTYVYEIYEQLGRVPENFFLPVGNGTLLIGCELALTELFEAGLIEKLPKIFIVQSENCAPFFGAIDKPLNINPKQTNAEGIAIGKPMRGVEILSSSYGGEREVITIPEDAIIPARQKLALNGFYVEHTTAAIYAAYESYIKKHELNGDSIISLCGAGLKSEH